MMMTAENEFRKIIMTLDLTLAERKCNAEKIKIKNNMTKKNHKKGRNVPSISNAKGLKTVTTDENTK